MERSIYEPKTVVVTNPLRSKKLRELYRKLDALEQSLLQLKTIVPRNRFIQEQIESLEAQIIEVQRQIQALKKDSEKTYEPYPLKPHFPEPKIYMHNQKLSSLDKNKVLFTNNKLQDSNAKLNNNANEFDEHNFEL